MRSLRSGAWPGPRGELPSAAMRRRLLAATGLATVALAAVPGAGTASTSHAGWPKIDMLLINKTDRNRPLDARPGKDPFAGTDRRYSCDAVHARGACQRYFTRGKKRRVRPGIKIHSELLGGHGSDTLNAGPYGDVLWGDYKPSGQPSTQHDRIFGGNGKDFVYASHGNNTIATGGGPDIVRARFGNGIIDCGGGTDTVFVSQRVGSGYTIRNCERVSTTSAGY